MSDLAELLMDQVDDAAARYRGEDFARAYGGGVARRVRRRRAVRAAGAGGTSALAVGALALGAVNAPWRGDAAPAGSDDCASAVPTPAERIVRHVVTKADGDQGAEVVVTLVYADTGEGLVTLSPDDDGADVSFATQAGGTVELTDAQQLPDGSYTVSLADGTTLTYRLVEDVPAGDGAAGAYTLTVEGLGEQDPNHLSGGPTGGATDCVTASPVASAAVPSEAAGASELPRPSPSPSPTASDRPRPTREETPPATSGATPSPAPTEGAEASHEAEVTSGPAATD